MEITRIEVTPFVVPRREPIKTAFGELHGHEHVLVAVQLEDGHWGYGEANPLPWNGGETVESVRAVVTTHLGPAVLGRDALRPALIGELLDRTQFAANPGARASVEMALLDARGRALRVPSRHLLGGYADSLRCTAILGSGSPGAVAAAAAGFGERLGISSFKIKVGLRLSDDIALVHAVRDAVGPDAVIYADANQAYTPSEAETFLINVRSASVTWFEEPCAAAAESRRALVASTMMPIIGDETCGDVDSATRSIREGRSSMLSVKPSRTGVSGTTALAQFGVLTGTPMLVGSTGESAWGTYASASVAAASAWTSAHPAELLMFQDYADDLVTGPTVVGGRLHLSDQPGFGPDFDLDALDRLRTGATTAITV